MFFRDVCKILGFYFLGLSALLLIPFCLAAYYQFVLDPALHLQPHSTFSFLAAIGISAFFGLLCLFFGKNSQGHIFKREGLVSVVLIWFLTPVIAGLPFYLSGTLENPLQAYFEACSGITTTGSTVMHSKQYDAHTGQEIPIQKTICGHHDAAYSFFGTITPVRNAAGEIIYEGIEAVSKALLFWRSFTNWLGGGGIVVLFVGIIPTIRSAGKLLFQAEVPGPNKEAFTPRIKETSITLWKIYLYLTVLAMAALFIFVPALEWLDVVTVALGVVSTGGFSIRNTNIAYYNSPTLEWILILFMILGSINFSLLYQAIKGKIYRLYEPEFILFLAILLIVSVIASTQLLGVQQIMLDGTTNTIASLHDAIRYGVFQMISTQTTTGFSLANYDSWPYLVQAVMWVAMFLGGMAGSTAGGIKIVRIIMLFKIALYKLESLFYPEAVRKFKVGDREIDEGIASMVLCFFLIVVAMSVLSTLFYIADGIDAETSFGLVACMINCTGLSFRMANPLESCAFLSNFSLGLSSFLMILGRLEFFAVLALFLPSFWKNS